MRTNKISAVQIKAQSKPADYLEDIKAHSEMWDEKSGTYQMTNENWHLMDKKWKPLTKPGYRPRNDVCQFARKEGCCGPSKCTIYGCDCNNPMDKECKVRIEHKG